MLKLIYNLIIFFGALLITVPVQAAVQPLPAEQAFTFSAYLEKPDRLIAEWQVAPGYYLYRDKLHIQAVPAKALRAGLIEWPASQNKVDPVRGVFRAYEHVVRIAIPLNGRLHQEWSLLVQYQGCSQEGFCYAPLKKQLQVTYPFSAEGLNNAPLLTVSEATSAAIERPLVKAPVLERHLLTDQGAIKAFLAAHAFMVTLICFLGLGLLLAFTPCSLPMIPILSSIIVGQQNRTLRKACYLSLTYVLGMALTYAGAGVLIAWVGSSVQAYFQSAWIISGFSLLFVLLALSMLDLFTIRLPGAWQQRLAGWQQQQQGGSYLGVLLMGCFSTLIVSPCVTAPLVGVLAYLSETGDLVLGASALFALGLGMGLPLLLLGFSAGKYLPQAGPWMEVIKKLFAFLLFGMAIWLLSRILPGGMTLFLWACLLILAAIFLFFVEGLSGFLQYLGYFVGGFLLVYAFVLFVGVAMDYTSPFYPFNRSGQKSAIMTASFRASHPSGFTELKTMAQLNALLQTAKQESKPVIIDFYADWCESCRALEERVLSESTVQDSLRPFVLLRANVTENNAFDQALLRRYHVIAPPTFLFFNRGGQEVMENRIVGEVDRHLFLARVNAI